MSDGPAPRPYRGYGGWLPGVGLIALGVIFLAREYYGFELRNWWALFILIPTFFTLERAYRYLRAGQTISATGPLIGGLTLLALTAIFLFNLPIDQLWPVFLIIAGIALLVSRRAWSLGL